MPYARYRAATTRSRVLRAYRAPRQRRLPSRPALMRRRTVRRAQTFRRARRVVTRYHRTIGRAGVLAGQGVSRAFTLAYPMALAGRYPAPNVWRNMNSAEQDQTHRALGVRHAVPPLWLAVARDRAAANRAGSRLLRASGVIQYVARNHGTSNFEVQHQAALVIDPDVAQQALAVFNGL